MRIRPVLHLFSIFLLALLCCTPAVAQLDTPTLSVNQDPISIHVVNTMLALSVIDTVLTAGAMYTFYKLNGGGLCSFGKSQAIPLVASTALMVTSIVARATFNSVWIAAASAFSVVQGIINPFRGYLGVWYHFFGGQPLPGMPEHHELLLVIGEEVQARSFSFAQFLSLHHHIQVAKEILDTFVWQHEHLGLRVASGSVFIGIPFVLMAAGITELSLGLSTLVILTGR